MNDIKDIINRLCDLERRMAKIESEESTLQEISDIGQEIEPVAWMFQHDETGRMSYVSNDGMNSPEYFLSMNPRYGFVCALYTAPPKREWFGLTEDEVIEWVESGEYNVITNDWASHIEFARAIETKLRERNT